MAFCMECGSPLQDGAKFCFQCGTPVKAPDKNMSKISVSDEGDSDYTKQAASVVPDSKQQDIPEKDISTWSKPKEEKKESRQQPAQQPINEVNDYEEDDDECDFSQYDFDRLEDDLNKESPDLSHLSTASHRNEMSSAANTRDPMEDLSLEQNPETDPFYDSIMPEIDNEIYQIPKEIFIRAVGIIVTIIAVVTWLLFILS